MKSVLIAGATGYLGRYLVSEYKRRDWRVHALVRNSSKAQEQDLNADIIVEAEATRPQTLRGVFDGIDLVVSSLGITRQKDGLSYLDVDYQANMNLLEAAIGSKVPHFAYIHVLGADRMPNVPLVAAKSAFVDALRNATIASTVIAPSGYFSDMGDFLEMAKSGRIWLFGRGTNQLNPIHGADLAAAAADAIANGEEWLDVGGPDILTQNELAELAFAALKKSRKITHVPDFVRRLALAVLPWVTPRHVSGPARFLLTVLGLDMVGQRRGTHHLVDYFEELAANDMRIRGKNRVNYR